MKWIKASERLPDKSGVYYIHYFPEGVSIDKQLIFFEDGFFYWGKPFTHPVNKKYVEWLDESHPEQGEQMAQDIMNILREHSTFVDGQIKALIVHGAIEKIVEYINGKLSSPPPQDERIKELENFLRTIRTGDLETIRKEASCLLIKK